LLVSRKPLLGGKHTILCKVTKGNTYTYLFILLLIIGYIKGIAKQYPIFFLKKFVLLEPRKTSLLLGEGDLSPLL